MPSRIVGTDSFSLDLKNKKERKTGSQHPAGLYRTQKDMCVCVCTHRHTHKCTQTDKHTHTPIQTHPQTHTDTSEKGNPDLESKRLWKDSISEFFYSPDTLA